MLTNAIRIVTSKSHILISDKSSRNKYIHSNQIIFTEFKILFYREFLGKFSTKTTEFSLLLFSEILRSV